MYTALQHLLRQQLTEIPKIPQERRSLLMQMGQHLAEELSTQGSCDLVFICTHNSRRSILAQVWAQVWTEYYALPSVHTFSGGTTVTAPAQPVLDCLQNQGMDVFRLGEEQEAFYALKSGPDAMPQLLFSKEYAHPFNPQNRFIAVMTCAHAEAHCPFIPQAAQRLSLPYDDPKAYDGHAEEAARYQETSLLIARELGLVFQQVAKVGHPSTRE